FIALPSTARPRLVASAGFPAALAAAVRRFSQSTGILGRSARLALAAATRTGAVEALLPDRIAVISARRPDHAPVSEADCLVARLAEIFGTDVVVALAVGAMRANRKPVLQVLTPGGRTLGFAKLALSPLAHRLVRAEAANLQSLAGQRFRHLELPEVVHHGTWRSHELLVMSALDTPLRRRRGRRSLPIAAMAELAAVAGTATRAVGETRWFAELRSATTDNREASASRFNDLLEHLAAQHGERPIRFGSWHGDWGPWNMAWADDRVRLWDWERFARGVPYGLDALHYSLPTSPESSSVARLRRAAAAALAPFETAADEAALVLTLYVTALCARFLPDSLTEHGEQLRRRVVKLLNLLEVLLADDGAVPAKHRPTGVRPRAAGGTWP
ncbi:MAG: phosphotransferase, partial [Actinomycetota bacterium]|nr:phosphotransferase [Actinomycetota bacterium]